jgi:HD-like signal output (HDOD) protein
MKSTPEDYTSIVNSLKGQLPSLPMVMDELMTIISDPNAALYAIKDIIKMDASIYSQILKVVNTVQYRGDDEPRIINLNDAMQRLGLEKVKRIALNTSVLTLFTGNQFPNNFSPESLWIHSVGVAVASASLADFLRFPMLDQAYSCGLIHDIGKLAKLKFDQKNFGEELNKAQELGLSNHQMEITQKKIRHERIDVEDSDIHKLIDIVQFSNSLINQIKFGNSGHNLKTEPSSLLMRRLKISESDLDEFEEKLQVELESEKEHLVLFTKN